MANASDYRNVRVFIQDFTLYVFVLQTDAIAVSAIVDLLSDSHKAHFPPRALMPSQFHADLRLTRRGGSRRIHASCRRWRARPIERVSVDGKPV